jgi:C-8 sterol isomerase
MTTSKENSGSFFIKLFCILTLLGAFFVKFDEIKDRFYIFDQNVLQGIAQKNIQLYSNDTHALVRSVVQDLEKEYPGHINVKEEWVFNTAGGAMGQMWIVHASITEYILIFGTDIGTEGHTGRYLCDDYFIILDGEQWSQRPGDLHRMVNFSLS